MNCCCWSDSDDYQSILLIAFSISRGDQLSQVDLCLGNLLLDRILVAVQLFYGCDRAGYFTSRELRYAMGKGKQEGALFGGFDIPCQ